MPRRITSRVFLKFRVEIPLRKEALNTSFINLFCIHDTLTLLIMNLKGKKNAVTMKFPFSGGVSGLGKKKLLSPFSSCGRARSTRNDLETIGSCKVKYYLGFIWRRQSGKKTERDRKARRDWSSASIKSTNSREDICVQNMLILPFNVEQVKPKKEKRIE